MPRDNKQFLLDIDKFVSKSNITVLEFRKQFVYDLFSRVVDRTPVFIEVYPTAGNTKYNWQCTIGAPSTRILSGTDKKGDSTKSRMKKVVDRWDDDQSIFFANSTPAIWAIEDGLYPSQPSKGSWNPSTRSYEIRSQGGFSKRAPSGVVKLTLTEAPQLRVQALRKAKQMNP